MFAGGKSGANVAEREARNGLFEQQKKLREEMRPHLEQRRRILDTMGKLKEDIKKKSGEAKEAKDKLPFRTINEMEQRVAELEAQMESGQFKLIEEKQILAEISKLKKARRALETIDGSSSDLGTLKLRLDKLKMDLVAIDDQVAPLKAQSEQVSRQIDELSGSKKEAQNAREDRQAAIDKLKKEINAYYQERRVAYDEYKAAKKAQADARLKRDARRVEYEKRHELEEKLEALEEKLLAFNPETAADRKIAECNNLKAYFQEMIGSKSESSEADVKKLEAGVRKVELSEELADAVPIGKKQDFCFVAPRSKKAVKNHNQAGPTPSSDPATLSKRLPFHIISALSDLSLPIPVSVADVPALFTALDAQKTFLATKNDTAAAEKEKQRQAIVAQIEELEKELAKPIKVTIDAEQ